MRASPACRDLIKSFETLKLTCYLCPSGIPTIGWGNTSSVTKADVGKKKITQQQAQRLFNSDVHDAELAIERNVKVPLTQGQFDCLVSFIFNTGEPKFKSSTLLRLLNQSKYEAVPAQLMRWVNGTDPKTNKKIELKGLVRRRRAELALWRGLDDEADDSPAAAFIDVEPTLAGKPLIKSATVQGAAVAAAGGAGVVVEGLRTVNDMKDAVSPFRDVDTWIVVAIGLVIVAGAAIAIYGRWRNREEVLA